MYQSYDSRIHVVSRAGKKRRNCSWGTLSLIHGLKREKLEILVVLSTNLFFIIFI